MAAYYIGSYESSTRTNSESTRLSCSGSFRGYGGEVLASDTSGLLVEGAKRTMNGIIRFPSKDAALAL